jgi:tetratricopeptide (TPR) repeat protein
MFKEHWFLGVGLDKFKLQYLEFQENYFRSGKHTIRELLLADNTQWAFNDYWQLILETGIVGIVALIVAFILARFLIVKALANSDGFLLRLCTLQLLAITIAALFTHLFEKLAIQLCYLFCLSVITYYAYGREKVKHVCVLFAAIAVLFLAKEAKAIRVYLHDDDRKEADMLFRAGYLEDSLKIYESLYPLMRGESRFLINYASVLVARNDVAKAIKIITQLLSVEKNQMYYDKLGQCYLKIGHTKRAEALFIKSVYMVPNRFLPRYHLYELYKMNGDLVRAERVANEIRNLPIKVPSNTVSQILKSIK